MKKKIQIFTGALRLKKETIVGLSVDHLAQLRGGGDVTIIKDPQTKPLPNPQPNPKPKPQPGNTDTLASIIGGQTCTVQG